MSTSSPAASSARLDRLGSVASALCSAHCLLCTLAPGLFGVLGVGVLLGHEAEWAFTLSAVGLALLSLGFGLRRHRSLAVAAGLAAGAAGLVVARLLEEAGSEVWAPVVGVLGGLALMLAHLSSVRALRSS